MSAANEAEPQIPGNFSPAQATDIIEIQQRIFFYGWCIDHRRFSDLDALFLPESTVHYDTPGGTKGPWPEIRDWLAPALRIFRCTQHNMHNTMVRFEEDGESARSTTQALIAHFQEKTDGEISVFRHSTIYWDRFVRRDGVWRILERRLANVGEDGPVLRENIRFYDVPKAL